MHTESVAAVVVVSIGMASSLSRHHLQLDRHGDAGIMRCIISNITQAKNAGT